MVDADLDGPTDVPTARCRDGLTFCPHCHGGVASSAELTGQIVNCPHCAQPFRMPEGSIHTFNSEANRGMPRRTMGISSQEPWFYRFIDTYASLWLWFNLLIIGLIDLGAIVMVVTMVQRGAITSPWALLIPIAVIVFMILELIGCLLLTAFMRLAVDVARNLREIRLRQSQQP